jgi:hypothetical protein
MRPLRVECYAGARADETPRALWPAGERLEVARVLRRWRSQDAARHEREWFRVLAEDGRRYLLCHDAAQDLWFLAEEESGRWS